MARAEAALARPQLKSAAEEEDESDPDRPYDLEVVAPRAVDLRQLYRLAGKPLPPDIEAALGPRLPVLLYQGLTPFHKPGARPIGVWGMGYQVELEGGIDGRTAAIAPEDRLFRTGEIEATVDVGVGGGGELAVPETALAVLNEVPALPLHRARVHATGHARFGLALRLDFSLLQVQAAPLGAGGARWNLYRRAERLDRFQPLVQTLLVPEGTTRLALRLTTWVRRRGWFFGLLRGREWISRPERYEVSLERLGA